MSHQYDVTNVAEVLRRFEMLVTGQKGAPLRGAAI
jgi:hypothetical protein